MADEENPFGGGPFGVGPFGPLVAAAVVAVGGINAGVSVTTSRVGVRTLHYQAKAFVAAPDEVLNPPVATAESFTVTTGQSFRRTLFYQANIAPPAFIAPAEVVVANLAWHAPFSAPPPRKLVLQRQQFQPFIPALAPPVTTAWLQPFKRQVAGPFPVHTQPVLAYTAAPQPTPDEWLQPFQRAVPVPAVHHTQPVSGYQPEAVVSNLTTSIEWLQPFNRAVPPPHPALSQPVFGYPYEAAVVSNLTTSLEWMVAWQKAVPAQPVHYTQPVHAQPTPNLTATLEWQIAWQKAVPTPPVRHTQPVYAYPYPTVENTIAGLGWIYRFEKAVAAPPVHHTQPVHAQPTPNLTATLEWMGAWQGPPRILQRLAAGPVYPLPPSNYRNEWDWPVAWNYAAKAPKPIHTQPVSGYPYVTVENTITGIAWLYRFEKAVPAPPVRHTQPFYGYPYIATPPPSNLTTTLEWLQKWQNPPRLLQRLAAGPVLPPAATPTVANTITGIAWLHGFQRVKPQRPIYTQPVLGRSDAARLDVAWLRGFDRAVAARQVRPTQPPFVYSPPVVVSNLTTTLEWQPPLSVAVRARPIWATQPDYGLGVPPEAVVDTGDINAGVGVTWSYSGVKTLFYQAWAFAFAPPPEVIVPPEPPPPIVQPKHSHGQITSVTARTTIDTSADVCVPAFQQDAFQFNAFQTCVGPSTTAVTSHGRIRPAARIHTSSRWRRSRTTIRTSGKGRTRPKDDP